MGAVASLVADLPRIAEAQVAGPDLDARLAGADRPFVMRGIAADWPLVVAGKDGPAAARSHLLGYARDRLFELQIGPPGENRIFYDDAMALNFEDRRLPLAEAFALIDKAEAMPSPPLLYMPSIDIAAFFDGFEDDNALQLGGRSTRDGIWIGGRTRVAAHNDVANNVAVAAVGRRRFILFPPGQFANLYLGPLDHSPGGRPVSMVDFADPDFERFPRFRDALDSAMVAELAAGDALFIPALWYHHVEGLDPFNVLVNYWWNDEPRWLGHPEDALYHAILAVRDLPPASRRQWQAMFDHYVFADDRSNADHLPDNARGILAPLDAQQAQKLRHYLLRRLSQ